jgi:iduronate 2-sulfatase
VGTVTRGEFTQRERMNPTRWRALGAIFVFVSSLVFAADAARRPNIIVIMADDLRPELGCYGVEGIKTPNIDALAARSVRFNHAAVQYALCNPSRSSLLTGRYPTQTGVFDNRQWWGAKLPNAITLPRWFRDHGYNTLREGKIFHEGIDDEKAWVVGGQARRYADTASEKLDGKDRAPDTKQPGETGNRASGSDRIVVLEGDGETYQDFRHATRAIELLKEYKGADKPFFLALGFTNPHSPPRSPQKYLDLYDVNKIPLPADFAPRPTVPPGFPELSVVPRNTDLFIGRDGDEAAAREMKRAYWAATTFMDMNVGRVLTALDELGLRDNTIVVFMGDHGYQLGEKGRWSKAYALWDVACRTPLLIAAPGVTAKNGAVCERTVEVLNLYRTLSDLAGLPEPAGVEGASMVPLLRDPKRAWDRPAYTVVQYRGNFGRSVSTERWHYADWNKGEGGTMLIDRVNDPRELKNLVADPKHAATVKEMQALMAKMPE